MQLQRATFSKKTGNREASAKLEQEAQSHRGSMSTTLQVAGLALIVAGTALISLPAGLIAAGIAAVLLGLAVAK